MRSRSSPRIGMAAIGHCDHASLYSLPNQWFKDRGLMGNRFTFYTGIKKRWISKLPEEALAAQAIENVLRATRYSRERIVALVFVSNSFIPTEFANLLPDEPRVQRERIDVAARRVAGLAQLGSLDEENILAIHWGCSGFTRAMTQIQKDLLPRLQMKSTDAILVAAATRTSRITDYEDRVSSPIFGDYATATLMTLADNPDLPPRYELVAATTGIKEVPQANFGHAMREHVLVPTEEGGETRIPERFCFWINGDIIYKYAPQIMAETAREALESFGIGPDEPDYIIPHQAGEGIGRWFERYRGEQGVAGEVINGHCVESGNVTSSSLPYTFAQNWDYPRGLVVCPTAGVGNPGEPIMSCGCAVFERNGA